MKKYIVLSLIILVTTLNLKAQDIVIDSNLTELSMPDSVNYNETVSHVVVVIFNQNYSGNVFLLAGVDSTAGIQSIDTVGFRSVTGMVPGDTLMFEVDETYNSTNGYRLTGNVVVIWPVAGTLTNSQFQTNVFVKNTVGISEYSAPYKAFAIYPNPTQDYIYIEYYLQNNIVNRVRLFDANSRLVYDEKFKSKIDIQALSKGIYLLNLELEDGEMLYYKVIKE